MSNIKNENRKSKVGKWEYKYEKWKKSVKLSGMNFSVCSIWLLEKNKISEFKFYPKFTFSKTDWKWKKWECGNDVFTSFVTLIWNPRIMKRNTVTTERQSKSLSGKYFARRDKNRKLKMWKQNRMKFEVGMWENLTLLIKTI